MPTALSSIQITIILPNARIPKILSTHAIIASISTTNHNYI